MRVKNGGEQASKFPPPVKHDALLNCRVSDVWVGQKQLLLDLLYVAARRWFVINAAMFVWRRINSDDDVDEDDSIGTRLAAPRGMRWRHTPWVAGESSSQHLKK